jgi:uncharacterized protein YdeI (YjbR/CyaY-like superfamily)
MGKRDARVDAYIKKSAEFAKPILNHFRDLVHAACPDVEESIKWQMPHFLYHGMLCGMAAFKAHCRIIFWKGAILFPDRHEKGMAHFGEITSLAGLPSDTKLTGYINQAARLNDSGVKVERPARSARKKKVVVPKDFQAALRENKKASAVFENFSPSHQREYAEWISDAKREKTRQKRLKQALQWIATGKPRNWKYMNC